MNLKKVNLILSLLVYRYALGYITSENASETISIPDPPEPDISDGGNARTNCPHLQPGLLNWDDENTWNGLTLPSPGTDVTIPTDSKVLVSKSVPYVLGIITVPESSELIFGEDVSGIEFDASGFSVNGALRAGSETCRIEKNIKINLHGSRPQDISNNAKPVNYKGIAVTGNGLLELHGKRYFRTWTRLADTVSPGSNKILLQHEVNWEPGQQIVLVTTAMKDAREFHQNEVLTIDYLLPSEVGTEVYLTTPVQFIHVANSGYQAEVGLLTRVITVSGSENDSEPTDPDPGNCNGRSIWGNRGVQCPNKELTGFGGHIIVANGGRGYVEGVELYRMGQTNVLGRYPMHFHILGNDCTGCYFKDSSVHHSFYRGVSIHGTHNITVTENVAYDVTGHCYYLEDGVEEDNTISFNLAAHIHYLGQAPWGSGQTTQINYQSSTLLLPADVTAAGFYITNVHNNLIGNAASGGYAGYAFPVLSQPIGVHKSTNMRPSSRTSLIIDGNTAHSTGWWWNHAPAFYFGGALYYDNDGETLVYNAGRDFNHLRSPCNKDMCKTGNCNEYCQIEDQAWLRVTNSKAFLVPSVGFNSWSGRMEVIKYEAHDVGLALESLESGFWIDQMLSVCRTGENWQLPPGSRATYMEGNGFFWYDTGVKHIITNSTFRNCGYRSESYNQYDDSPNRGCGNSPENGCHSGSTTFGFLTHSDQHTPQQLQATRLISFQNCGRRFKLHNYHGDNSPSTVSAREQNWLDVDGTVSGMNEPTLIGSGVVEAGLWWHVDSDVVHDPQGPLKFIQKNNGPERNLGYFKMLWDEAQHNQVGSSLCGNGNLAPCPALGYIKHKGPLFASDNGLPVTASSNIIGLTGGFGWLLKLNRGAPHSLKLKFIEVRPDSPLLLSIPYPSGTSFSITAHAAYCSPNNSYSCKETFKSVSSVKEVRESLGNTYHVDSRGILTVRIIQTPQTFTGNPNWLLPNYDTIGKWNNGLALSRFSRNGVLLPMLSHGPWLDILADCSRGSGDSSAYCAQTPSNESPEVCPQGYNQVSYDKCCNSIECLFADGSIASINPPTPQPSVHLTPSPTSKISNKPSSEPTSLVNPPTSSTAPSLLTPSPTLNPVSPTSVPPTMSPTVPEGCYSINNKDCLPVGYDSSFCNKIWLPNGAQNNCIALGGECTSNHSGCCEPAECFIGENYATCVPRSETTSDPTKAPTFVSPTFSPSPSCTICDDEPTKGMKKKGKTCTDIKLKEKCNKNASWIKKGYCQLSCYNEGLGYDGDVCCTDTS
jgi:hypothetical protein